MQTFVLTRDLRLARTLYGWPTALLPDESIVYQHSVPHFAPTHPVEFSVFNMVTLQDKEIYPPSPDQPARIDFTKRVSRGYQLLGDDWFAIHNYPSDPKSFDTGLRSEVVMDASSNSIAFLIQFGPWDPGIKEPIDFTEQVVVTCSPMNRINPIQCRERPLADWRRALSLPLASIDEVIHQAASRPTLVP